MQMPSSNTQGLAGLPSQGRAPQQAPQGMPPQPGAQQGAPQMPTPTKSSPTAGFGSVQDRVDAYRGNPQALQGKYTMGQDLLDLLALQQIKGEKETAARQMQLQMGQQAAAQGEPPTIAQQREQEVTSLTKNELAQQRGATANQQLSQQQAMMQKMMGGLAGAPGANTAAQPKMMASGGIVAFAGPEGSVVEGVMDAVDYFDDMGEPLTSAEVKSKVARGESVFKKVGNALKDATNSVRNALQPSSKLLNPKIPMPTASGTANVAKGAGKMGIGALKLAGKAAGPLAAADMATTAYDLYNTPTEDLRKLYGREGEESSLMGDIGVRARGAAGMLNPFGDTNDKLAKLRQERQQPTPAAPPEDTTGLGDSKLPPAGVTTPPVQPPQQGGIAGLGAAASAPQLAAPKNTPPTFTPTEQPAYLADALKKGVGRDPAAEGLEEEKRVEARLKLTPDQLAVYEKGNQQRQSMYDTQYNPEQLRQRQIAEALMGAGGRAYGELAGGARAGRAFEDRTNAARKLDFEALQKGREGLVSLDRAGIKEGIEAGKSAREKAEEGQKSSTTSATTAYGYKSQEGSNAYTAQLRSYDAGLAQDVEMKKAELVAETNRLTKTGLSDNRALAFISNTRKWISDQTRKLDEGFNKHPRWGMLNMADPKTLKPQDVQDLKIARLELQKAQNALEQSMEPALAAAEATLGIGFNKSNPELDKYLAKYGNKK